MVRKKIMEISDEIIKKRHEFLKELNEEHKFRHKYA
jgi:hypothetical protein